MDITLVGLSYLGIVWQLVVTPIPSEASSYQLVFASHERPTSATIARQSSKPVGIKALLFALPVVLSLAALILPPLALFSSGFRESWGMIQALSSVEIRTAGSAVAFLGSAISTVAAHQLHRARRADLGRIFDAGLFGLSRNPIVVGVWIFYVGLFFVCPHALFGLGVIIFIINMHQRVRLEESQLAFRFGSRYESYQSRVARYFPSWRRNSP